jgi:predicted transporter
MTFPKIVEQVSVIAQIGTNAVIALCVFGLWRKVRETFLLIFGMNALLGLCTGLAAYFIKWYPLSDQQNKVIWSVSSITTIIDMILYAIAIIGMVRYLRRSESRADAAREP